MSEPVAESSVWVGGYRIEADVELSSDWLPASAFTMIYPTVEGAIPVAIEGVADAEIDEVRIVHVATGRVAWRSTDDDVDGPTVDPARWDCARPVVSCRLSRENRYGRSGREGRRQRGVVDGHRSAPCRGRCIDR
ncbi:hypothetical protein [Pseudonocardia sp. ICBG1293]|uniref:hypothetical protein n=1 Tax=Pseudonocardia sp. ICBG1293 TaxID=2844382 RepID=UPI001CCE4513|nr:hypothetical protein [Pseudonocardia sp. ICBG1293]